MKWDLAEQYLPWRHFLSRSILSAEIPFWNPFQLGGYPTYLDPQSGFWYYPAWIISLAGPYTMQLIEWEYCTLLVFAGWGFFKLSQHLKFNNIAGIATGIAYALSGFMIANAQHLTWIIAAAYLPWVIYLYLKWKENPNWYSTFLFILIFYCFSTGSYPAFTLTVFYLILVNFFIHLYKTSDRAQAFRWSLILVAGILISLAPILYAFASESIYFSRGAGVTIQKALQHPFSIPSLSTLLFPFASLTNETFFNTDLSMRNAYMGIFILPLLIIWIMRKKKSEGVVMAILAVVFLLISVGEALPFRTFLYNYIPGFDLFRFPALFRLFTIFFTLLLCAHIIHHLQEPLEKNTQRLLIAPLAFFALTFLLLVIKNGWQWFPIFDLAALSVAIENANFGSLLGFQFAFQCILLFSIIVILRKQKIFYLIIIVAVDLFFATRLNQMGTVLYPIKTRQVDQLISSANGPFQPPQIQAQNQTIDQAYPNRWPLNWNLNNYFGQIAIDGYNPFVLNTFNELSDANNRDSVWQYPWYYLSLSNPLLTGETSSEDASLRSITLEKFRTNSFSWRLDSGVSAQIVIAQNPYKHWSASANEHEIKIKSINIAQQLIEVDTTQPVTIQMEFYPKTIAILMFIQIAFLLGITGLLIISFIKNFTFTPK